MKRILPVLLCLLLLCGCGTINPPADAGKINIVTTVFPLYDFARAVGGDRINLKMLIDPGTEVHAFDPSPSDIMAITNADLFLYIGGESDEWVSALLGDSKIDSLLLMDTVELLTEDGEDEYDEHIWTSPANAIAMIKAICDVLIEIDNGNASYYRTNCEGYTQKIQAVQQEIRQVIANISRPFLLVADRFPFKYFVTEFGIDYEAAFGGCAASTDISLKTMTRLVKVIEEQNCKSAFYVEMSNRNIADALAQETGVTLYELNSAHTVSRDDFNAGVTYADIMKSNAEALRKGLG